MITMTDLFCGAGGSSTGALAVAGVEVRMAANHWKLAIETHNTNHPTTDHACADIHLADPRFFPHTDILWASPECTKWTVASGKAAANIDPGLFEDPLSDEAAQRSRMLMFDVPKFAAHHRYRAVIVENVVDVSTRPMYVAAFERWLIEMTKLGYDHREVYLNSMHAQGGGMPAPQSRDRLYIVFWLRGQRAPDLEKWTRPQAWCEDHGLVNAMQSWKNRTRRGRYRAQYVWRCPRMECRHSVVEPAWLPAAAAIDWSLPGQRIGDRAKPLAAKTMARIEAGLKKYAAPLLVPVEGRDEKEARAITEAMRTMTTRSETAFVVPLRANNTPKAVREPFDTFAANGNHHALVMRNNSSKGAGAEMITPITEVLRTLTTMGHQSLLIPYRSQSRARPTSDPMPTLSTIDPAALASMATDVQDCRFRMLEPREIAAGMAFPNTYVIKGNRREQVRQAGNAVTPPAARDLIAAVVESLGGAA